MGGKRRPMAGCRFACSRMEKVMQALDLVSQRSQATGKSAAGAAKKMSRSIQSRRTGRKNLRSTEVRPRQTASERSLPPAGAVMPPLV